MKESNSLAHLAAGQKLAQAGALEAAFAHYRLALEYEDSREEAALLIKELLAQHYSVSSALELLAVLQQKFPQVNNLQTNPNSPNDLSWRELVPSMIAAADFTAALQLLLDQLPLGQDLFTLYNYVGMVKYQQSYYAEASEWFLRALNINPGAENVLLNFHDACLQLGNSYAVRPQLEKALLYNPQSQILKMITQELQGAANNSLEVQKLSQLRHFNSEVERYLREGMLAQARQKLTEVLDLDPLYYRTLNNWGISAWLERDFAAAYNYFKQAVLANPWFLDALSNLYNSAVQLQNTKDIPEVLALVARVNGDNADFIEIKNRINQGQATGFAPPLDVEAQAWEQASLQVQRGYELLDQGEIDKAILLFGEVLDQHPRHIDALNGMGIGAFHRGNVEDAYAIFKQAVEFYPLDNDSLKNLWDAAQQVGQNAQALIYLENAVAVDSNLAEIRQIIESQGEW